MDNEIINIDSLESWRILKEDSNSNLIDVRTSLEWKLNGIIDLSSIGKQVILLSWNNDEENFKKNLAEILPINSGKLFFICQSGVRSLKVAQLIDKRTYSSSCYNIFDGYGGINNSNYNGWVGNSLPWRYLND